jgi:TRAP-type C4-dicarboxylate transport system permease large subunit
MSGSAAAGGLAIGTIGLMVLVSAMNGLVGRGHGDRGDHRAAGTAAPGLRQADGDGRDPGGVSLGILVPPSVVLVLYAMIARQPVGQLWLAGVVPGLMMAGCSSSTSGCAAGSSRAGPGPDAEERDVPRAEKLRLLGAGSCRWRSSRDDGALRQRLDQPGGKLGHRRADGDLLAAA